MEQGGNLFEIGAKYENSGFNATLPIIQYQ